MKVKDFIKLCPYDSVLFIEEHIYKNKYAEWGTMKETSYTVGKNNKIPAAEKEITMVGAMDRLELHIRVENEYQE